MTEGVEYLGKEIVEMTQLAEILDHANSLEIEFIHSLGKVIIEPSLIILQFKMYLGLDSNKLLDPGTGKKLGDCLWVISFDNLPIIKERVPNIDILESEELANTGE